MRRPSAPLRCHSAAGLDWTSLGEARVQVLPGQHEAWCLKGRAELPPASPRSERVQLALLPKWLLGSASPRLLSERGGHIIFGLTQTWCWSVPAGPGGKLASYRGKYLFHVSIKITSWAWQEESGLVPLLPQV